MNTIIITATKPVKDQNAIDLVLIVASLPQPITEAFAAQSMIQIVSINLN